MTAYEKAFNGAIAKIIREAEEYEVSPYQINWLNVFIWTQDKVNKEFQEAKI